MPYNPTPTNQAGGIIELTYSDGGFNTHTIRQHVSQFDPNPEDSTGDYVYTHAGPKRSVTEHGIIQTFNAMAALWRPFYPETFALSLTSVWYNSGGIMTVLPTVPVISPVIGNYSAMVPLPAIKRTYEFYSTQNGPADRLYLMQTPGEVVAHSVRLTPTDGGFDSRDVNWAAYLCSDLSGVVGTDGWPLQSPGRVSQWWAHALLPGMGGGGGGFDIYIAAEEPVVTSAAFWVDISSGDASPNYPLLVYNPVAHRWVNVGGLGEIVSG